MLYLYNSVPAQKAGEKKKSCSDIIRKKISARTPQFPEYQMNRALIKLYTMDGFIFVCNKFSWIEKNSNPWL